jgi:hypothetical protein
VLADVPLHAGLICIDAPTGMNLSLQRLLFGFVLEELEQAPDLTNQILEVTISDAGDAVDIVRYGLPSEN